MCKFAEGKNFKMTQNLYLHVFTEIGWEENVFLDDPIARQGLHEEKKKSFLYSSVSFWRVFFSSFCCQSASFLFYSLSLLDCGSRCGFCWHMNVAHNRGACASVYKCYALCIVCIAVGCCVWVAANYCALLGFFLLAQKNEPYSMRWMQWKQTTDFFRFFFILI